MCCAGQRLNSDNDVKLNSTWNCYYAKHKRLERVIGSCLTNSGLECQLSSASPAARIRSMTHLLFFLYMDIEQHIASFENVFYWHCQSPVTISKCTNNRCSNSKPIQAAIALRPPPLTTAQQLNVFCNSSYRSYSN